VGELRYCEIIFRARDGNNRVIDDMTYCDICIQVLRVLVDGVRRHARQT